MMHLSNYTYKVIGISAESKAKAMKIIDKDYQNYVVTAINLVEKITSPALEMLNIKQIHENKKSDR